MVSAQDVSGYMLSLCGSIVGIFPILVTLFFGDLIFGVPNLVLGDYTLLLYLASFAGVGAVVLGALFGLSGKNSIYYGVGVGATAGTLTFGAFILYEFIQGAISWSVDFASWLTWFYLAICVAITIGASWAIYTLGEQAKQ